MLLIDVSNVMYTGSGYKGHNFGQKTIHKLNSIPYFLKTIAALHMHTPNMVAIFEKNERIPAMAKGSGYKSGRQRNSKVEWEIKALRKILEKANFPILEVEGNETDYVIYNYCRQHRYEQDIFIASADMDMASQVSSDESGSVELVSFSSISYNVNKTNFYEITGVDYNFMNLNKILLGCKSDKIKPYPNGKEIYGDYVGMVKSTLRRGYGFDPSQPMSTLPDKVINTYNTYESFLEWFRNSSFFSNEAITELNKRQRLVMGPIFNIGAVPPTNWVDYNAIVKAFNLKAGLVESANVPPFTMDLYNEMEELLDSVSQEYSIFEEDQSIEIVPDTPQLRNLLGVLDKGGF